MKKISLLTTLMLGAGACLHATHVQAQSPRTFVSGTGSDGSATCGRAAPCRTFAGAIGKTDAGGEIVVLDAAGYGTVVIDKSISIINDGVGEAGIRPATDQIGITINAGKGNVYLRGLTIDGGGTGFQGIQFNNGQSLTIDNCVVRNFAAASSPTTSDGIRVQTSTPVHVALSNTLVENNRGSGVFLGGRGNLTAVLTRVQAHSNGAGIYLNGNSSSGLLSATVVDSVAARSETGFGTESFSGGGMVSLTLVRSVAAYNTVGIQAAGPNSIVRSTRSIVTGNRTGWFGSALKSYGDNAIDGNADDGGFPPTIPTR